MAFDLSTLKTGDFITAQVNKLPFLYHRGIVVIDQDCANVYHNSPDCISVYHNTPNYKNELGGGINVDQIADWLKTRTIVSVMSTNMTKEYIENMSVSLADRVFNLLTFNCEHYAFQLKDGYPYSPQLKFWTTILLGSLVGYLIFRYFG